MYIEHFYESASWNWRLRLPTATYNPVSYRQAFFDRLVGGEGSDGEWRAFCPICEDPATSKSESANFNFGKGVFHCQSCGWGGKLSDLKKKLEKEKGFNFRSARMKGAQATPEMRSTFRERKDPEAEKPLPTMEDLKKYHNRLMRSEERLRYITRMRGLSAETLVDWNIGYDGERYLIPVFDENFDLVNVRRYKPNTTGNNKMLSWGPGYGTARIFGEYILGKNDEVVLTEGELDCIVLNQAGIPAVTHTAGASTFKAEWGKKFKDKVVYICYDNDDTGKKGAQKAAFHIRPHAEAVYILELPVDTRGFDVTDYLVKEGAGAEDFRELMRAAHEEAVARPVMPERPEPKGEGVRITLEASMSQENENDVLDMTIQVAGKQNPPFKVPKKVDINCDMGAGTPCGSCPIADHNGHTTVEFKPDDGDLFEFLRQPTDKWRQTMKRMTGAKCTNFVQFDYDETWNMEQLIVGNAIDDRDPGVSQTPLTREIYSVSTHATPVNTTVRVVGKNVLDPRDGRLSFMAWKNEGVRTSLDEFQMTEEMLDYLALFSKQDGQSPLERCEEIADDMETHITQIYGRRMLHMAYDLVWHSPLSFRIGERLMEKGWLEMIVVGDTRTGKSETAIRLAEHYQAGIVKSCEGATFAGLVGGAQQMGRQGPWAVTWGVIPLNDRRLVVLDEVSGLKDKDVIENMSSIRSSGRAEITKITSEETSARTRLIWITNPGDGSMIADHPDAGVAALRTVVHANEDIARFDFAMAATAAEVDPELINATAKPKGTTKFTSDACQTLILWVWSRRPDQVQFTKEAVLLGAEEAVKVGEKYHPDPPLLQPENARFKIYRIAAAIAARTFSTVTGEEIFVGAEHIRAAVEFLDRIYDFEGMGYARKSRRVLASRRAAAEKRTACREWLIAHPDTVLHTLQSIGGTTFRGRDFEDIGRMSRDEAADAVHKLIGWKMVLRKSRGDLAMDRSLIGILKEFDDREYED
jgi:hypothetical protein